MPRIFEQPVTFGDFDYAAEIHNGNAISKVMDDGKVVADKQVSQIELFAYIFQKIENLTLDRYVQS